ncbi:MAG: hypothetical protein OXU36_14090 [Candidatus Poribacteria bacterium]|nr:hypothetical protein [Candidatus Poribacteria bacterium]
MEKEQWTIAHDLAFDLVDRGTDPNELGKVIAFVRQNKTESDMKDRLTSLVQRLSNSRNALIRSRQTQRFYQNIQEAFQEHLHDIEDTTELLLILGWSLRLMRYYRIEPKRAVEEQRPQQPQQQPQQPKIIPPPLPKEKPKPKIKVSDKVNATILKKEGFKVTVQLDTDNKEELIFERPYYPGAVGAQVKLRVLGINEDGHVTNVVP